MPGKKTKLILDTNIWISFIISDRLKYLDNTILRADIQLLFSEELIEEFIIVSRRAKFAEFFKDKDIEKLLRLFRIYGVLYKTKSQIKICRDSKDNFLLSLAINSGADYLATGDKDLLEIRKVGKTMIISLHELEEILK